MCTVSVDKILHLSGLYRNNQKSHAREKNSAPIHWLLLPHTNFLSTPNRERIPQLNNCEHMLAMPISCGK